MRGIWMWAQNVIAYGAEKTLDSCRRAGITDVFFLTKGLAGTAAFRSAYAPWMCERDLLQEVLDAAHRRGIRVHAWFTSTCDEHYKQLHPESGRCHYRRGRDRELISLCDAGYLAYQEQIVREVCSRYEIDGLHLDYIRYNHLLYGWGEEELARYRAEGADEKHLRQLLERHFYGEAKEETLLFDAYREGDESVRAFARARRNDVIRFASRLTQTAKDEKGHLTLSAALMPEGAYEDTAFADLHYGQSYEDAARLYDYAVPMAYSKAYEQDACWVRRVAEGSIRKGNKTLIGLHAYGGGTGPSLQADANAVKNVPVEGICLFREGATAMAYAEGKEVSVYNALTEPLTGISFLSGEESVMKTETIHPGEEKRFHLPFETDALRVFEGMEERCVYLNREE